MSDDRTHEGPPGPLDPDEPVPDDASALDPRVTATAREVLELLDDSRAREATSSRVRERSLRQQASESAALAGLLLGAAEQSLRLTVRCISGRGYQGTVVTVGEDFCAVVSDAGVETYIALRAVTTVRPERAIRSHDAADDRPPPLGVRLVEVLAEEVPERPRVALVAAGDPEPVVGTLRTVGLDVATVELDGRREVVYVRTPSVTEVSFLASG